MSSLRYNWIVASAEQTSSPSSGCGRYRKLDTYAPTRDRIRSHPSFKRKTSDSRAASTFRRVPKADPLSLESISHVYVTGRGFAIRVTSCVLPRHTRNQLELDGGNVASRQSRIWLPGRLSILILGDTDHTHAHGRTVCPTSTFILDSGVLWVPSNVWSALAS